MLVIERCAHDLRLLFVFASKEETCLLHQTLHSAASLFSRRILCFSFILFSRSVFLESLFPRTSLNILPEGHLNLNVLSRVRTDLALDVVEKFFPGRFLMWR